MNSSLSRDNLFEIISWLPAKAIYKFMSTCKLFSKFPKENYFGRRQAQHALLRDDTCFFVQSDILTNTIGWHLKFHLEVEFYSLPDQESSSGVSHNGLYFFNNAKILSSYNGLILCCMVKNKEVNFFISNPATQSCWPIPTPPEHIQNSSVVFNHKIGLVCDSEGNLMMYHFIDNLDHWSSYLDCKVYSFKEGVWKEKAENFFIGSRSLRFDIPVHLKGAVHFISGCFPYLTRNDPYFRPYIMSYNFEDGKSRMLRLPKEARRGSYDISCNMRIFPWRKVNDPNQSICLVRLRKRVFTVWVLREYESSLWKKILKIRIKAMRLLESDPSDLQVKDFSLLNGEFLAFATQKKVYLYGLSDKRIHKSWDHQIEWDFVRFISYSDTLHPYDLGATDLSLPSSM